MYGHLFLRKKAACVKFGPSDGRNVSPDEIESDATERRSGSLSRESHGCCMKVLRQEFRSVDPCMFTQK